MTTRTGIRSRLMGTRRVGRLSVISAMATAVVLLWLAPAYGQRTVRPRAGKAGEWRVIGKLQAGFTADHDTLIVRGPNDNFRRIKFKVTGAGLNLRRLRVTYDNGAPDEIQIREDIPEGGESRQIDLRGVGRRSIRKIDFWYDTKGLLKGRATVTVLGMH